MKILKDVIKIVLPHKLLLSIIIISLSAVSFSLLSLGGQIKSLIDQGIHYENLSFVNAKAIQIIGILVIFSIASFMRSYCVNNLIVIVINNLRFKLYSHLLKLKIEFFEETKISTLQSKIISDTNSLSYIIQQLFSFFLRNSLLFLGSVFMMYAQSKLLFMIVISFVVFLSIPLVFFMKRFRKKFQKQQSSIEYLGALIQETFSNIKLIYSYNLQKQQQKTFTRTANELIRKTIKSNKSKAFYFSAIICFICISITLIIWLGSYQVIEKQISSGELVSFIIYTLMAVVSLIGIINNSSDIAPHLLHLQDALKLLEAEDFENRKGKNLDIFQDFDIEFKDVCFSYPTRPDIKVMNKLNLKIKQEQFTALYGPSGCGKSTLLHLLLKLYNPSEGKIFIAGKDIAEISATQLRQNILLVSQETLIFSTSVLENITLGKTYSAQCIENIIQMCDLTDFVTQLTDGLETFIGEKGVRISGGQKQKIAIARSLILTPKILMLDEATSALDPESESFIISNIKKQVETIIFVSHNQKTLSQADKLYNLIIN